MRDIGAIQTALAMIQTPALVRTARRLPLPPGMTFLLEVAANDDEALKAARAITGQSNEVLLKACGFFIEQVLLTNVTDSFRVLAGGPEVPASDLRRNMALLMKWLHPDMAANGDRTDQIDRSVLANRVTKAWEDLKTEKRRTAYALNRAKKAAIGARKGRPPPSLTIKTARPQRKIAKGMFRKDSRPRRSSRSTKPVPQIKGRRYKRLVIQPLGHDGLFSRLILFLKRQG